MQLEVITVQLVVTAEDLVVKVVALLPTAVELVMVVKSVDDISMTSAHGIVTTDGGSSASSSSSSTSASTSDDATTKYNC